MCLFPVAPAQPPENNSLSPHCLSRKGVFSQALRVVLSLNRVHGQECSLHSVHGMVHITHKPCTHVCFPGPF